MFIKQLSNRYACDLACQYGFSHRKPNAVVSYGLVDKSFVIGSIVYGNTASPNVALICGDDEFYNVMSINSIWFKEHVKTSVIVKMLLRTIAKIEKEIIVAYIDTSQTRYVDVLNKANFIYCGLTEERVDKGYIGEVKNTLFGKKLVKKNVHNISAWYDKENTVDVIRKQKHRYVFFNTKDEARKEVLYNNLIYYELPKPD